MDGLSDPQVFKGDIKLKAAVGRFEHLVQRVNFSFNSVTLNLEILQH